VNYARDRCKTDSQLRIAKFQQIPEIHGITFLGEGSKVQLFSKGSESFIPMEQISIIQLADGDQRKQTTDVNFPLC
jgi:hypothetical protein